MHMILTVRLAGSNKKWVEEHMRGCPVMQGTHEGSRVPGAPYFLERVQRVHCSVAKPAATNWDSTKFTENMPITHPEGPHVFHTGISR